MNICQKILDKRSDIVYIHENSFRVRYGETDQMGIVYHANYYVWYDMGRTELLRSLGYDYSGLEKQGVLFPVLETHCVHKKTAVYDQLITVRTMISEMKGVRIGFKYEVYNEDKELIAYGETGHAFVNRDMKPVNLKKVLPMVHEKLISCL